MWMLPVGIPIGLWLSAGGGGCSCQPELPANPTGDDDDDVTETTGTTAVTGDTGPEPPCAAPELEDNGSLATANVLPMEQHGCGEINPAADLDFWSFTLEDDSWLSIDVVAGSGSQADMSFLLTPKVGAWAASRPDGPQTLDASLTFLAPAGEYNLAVSEQTFAGGERYGYDVLVSEAKPPVEPWTRGEVEPNDGAAEAEPVQPGDVIYGTMEGNPGGLGDADFFSIVIPAGPHALLFDIEAYDVGSSADLTIYLYDPDMTPLPLGCKANCAGDPSCTPCAFRGGISGVELDPFGEYESFGAEIVLIHVKEAGDKRSPANWYTLSIGLEER